MAGHLFVTQGDLAQLACDAWALPTDADGWVTARWFNAAPELAAAFGEDQMNRSDLLLDGKQKKRLLSKAVRAYDGLGRLEPLKVG